MHPNCPFCSKVQAVNPADITDFIFEFEHSILCLGAHQFYPGYSVLFTKQHARELHQLTPEVQRVLFHELMQAGQAIATQTQAWKMNYLSLGNVVEHIHWHIVPRHLADPQHLEAPLLNAALVPAAADPAAKQTTITAIRKQLNNS